MTRLRFAALAALLLTLLVAPAASGSWHLSHQATGYSSARSMATPSAPSASASARNVTVSWSAPSAGPPPTGYVVRRYDAGGGAPATVLASCAGSQSGLSCTESPVPSGDWRYTVTARRGDWQGQESPLSPAVTVDAPALSLTPTTITSLPATLSGGVTGFAPGQSLVARLDDPDSGLLLGGSMNTTVVPASGSATGSAVIPASVANGPHVIYVVGSDGDVASQPITVTTPSVSAATIAKTAGGDPGFVKRSGTYYVYANVAGSGSPPAGLATVRADVSSLTAGQTSVAMTAGSYSVGGSSYNYRSAQLTAASTLTEGSKSFSVTATDAGGTRRPPTNRSSPTTPPRPPPPSRLRTGREGPSGARSSATRSR